MALFVIVHDVTIILLIIEIFDRAYLSRFSVYPVFRGAGMGGGGLIRACEWIIFLLFSVRYLL